MSENALARIVVAAVLLMVVGCRETQGTQVRVELDELDRVPKETWTALARKNIFFGHQSVGMNLVDGIREIQQARPAITLAVRDTRDPGAFHEGVFGHAKVGKNQQPLLKFTDFRQVLNGGVGDQLDVGLIKLCYVDIVDGTDITPVYEQFATLLRQDASAHPNVKRVTMTVPLTAVPAGIVDSIKRRLGRGATDFKDNLVRHRLNEMLVRDFGRSGRLFDIAAWESTYPDGRTHTVSRDGISVPALVPEYTDDGGHLNELGRRWVSQKLLLFLAGL